MSSTPFAAEAEAPRLLFEAILRPHRSLSRTGFRCLMAVFATLSLALGAFFFAIGAWPVVGFLGLDVLLLYAAFKLNFFGGRLVERVRLTAAELTVDRISALGRHARWRFQPYWLRIAFDDPPSHDSRLTLSSHGRSLVVGAFLSPGERHEIAARLSAALDRWRHGGWDPADRAAH
jgi:uncharacterized membrane protein